MIIATTLAPLKETIQSWKSAGLSIGFVPTMGNLHAGHISLLNEARSKCDKVVVSIFVNPLQFNESSDFAAYPKTLQADQQQLTDAGADLLFLPDSGLMYPHGQAAITKVMVPYITEMLEGACRPGHFDGVATVVLKLFNLVQPEQAFFGEKDFQQLLLVKKMVVDLNLPIAIISVSTMREADGLAMSSRNSRLNSEQRKLAAKLYEVLQRARAQLLNDARAVEEVQSNACEELLKSGFEPEYVSLREADNLQPASASSVNRVLLVAARLGDVRLIDNLLID